MVCCVASPGRPSGRMIMQVILLASLPAFAAGTATAAATAAASLSIETTSNKALQAPPPPTNRHGGLIIHIYF